MSEQKPPRPRPRPQPRGTPKGFDDVPILSDAEVQRRIDVRGGAAPRGPVERAPRVARPPRRKERTVARDSLLLIGLVIVGLVAARVLLPDGPLSATATGAPSGTEAALASISPAASSGRTPGIQTLVPVITLPPGTVPPTVLVEPTAPPPTPTSKPGATPKPTPKPTAKPTATPTPGPTAPNRATVLVKLVVVRDSGGSSTVVPSDWTIHVSVEGGLTATPNNFAGSAAGTSVSIPAGNGFTITSNDARSGYSASPIDPDCSKAFGGSGLPPGPAATCTITRDDIPARLDLTVAFVGAQPGNPDLSITGTASASPSSITSFGTTMVTLNANADYQVNEVTPISGYTLAISPTGCSSTGGLALNQTESCTYTYTEVTPPPVSPLPFLILPLLRPRRWRTTATG